MNICSRILGRSIAFSLRYFDYLPRNISISSRISPIIRSYKLSFPENHPLKRLYEVESDSTAYGLSDASLVWLWNRLLKRNPEIILEMGSGRSTAMFSLYAQAKEYRSGKYPLIISIEDSKEYLEATEEKLKNLGIQKYTTFLNFDAVNIAGHAGMHGYAIDEEKINKLLPGRGVDFLFIDGPAGGRGRAGTLPSVFSILSKGADVFLDDALRPEEMKSVEYWRSFYKKDIKFLGLVPLGKGIAWLKKA